MTVNLRSLLLGRPLATSQASHERLSKRLALAVFSSDALSSTAYATEEILRVLLVAGTGVLHLSWPIAVGIGVLLVIVSLSYRQTIFAYPSGGGSYIVAKENLGETPGLIAAASLLIDYVLTVSVSIAAGVAALVSAFHGLQPFAVELCLLFIVLVAYANLRGLKESGAVFAVPTYSFIASMALLVVVGLIRSIGGEPVVVNPRAAEAAREAIAAHGGVPSGVTLFLILRAFASGCTALTGVEAISNGIPAFKRPESANAAKTLTAMVLILTSLFLGLTFIANHFQIPALPEESAHYETVISQIAARVFGGKNVLYLFVQFATAAILIVAANTSYADFPRLASLLARDRYLPRQLADLGDRLVFNNGIVILTALAMGLILIFKGSVTSLIPLYAVGVFTSFTLSQAGMVRHWSMDRGKGWRISAAVNLLGAIATGVVMLVIGVTKFNAGEPFVAAWGLNYGAWMVIVLVPILVALFRKIHGHYREVAAHLDSALLTRLPRDLAVHHTVLVLIPRLHQGILPALVYARSLSPDARAVYIEVDPAATPALKEEWEHHVEDIPLIVIESPYRSLRQPLLEYILEVNDERADDELTVVIPELIAGRKWWHRFLHNASAQSIRRALIRRPGVVVTSYRYFADDASRETWQNHVEHA